jgi:hypothetical protein
MKTHMNPQRSLTAGTLLMPALQRRQRGGTILHRRHQRLDVQHRNT